MAGDSVRELYLGLQATAGTPAATLFSVPTDDFVPKLHRNRKPTSEYFGTLVKERKNLGSGEYDEINLKSDQYYAWHGQLLASLIKLPTTIAYPGEATVVKQHTFIEAVTPPLMTVKYTNGVQWWQMLDCVVEQGKWTMGVETKTATEFDLMGLPATPIGNIDNSIAMALSTIDGPAPWGDLLMRQGTTGHVTRIFVTAAGTGYTTTAPTIGFTGGGGGSGATAVATMTGQSPTLGGVAYITITSEGTGYTAIPTVTFTGGAGTGAAATAVIGGVPLDFMSGDVTIKRNRKPRFPSRRNVNPKRFTDGPLSISFSINPDYTSDTASLFLNYRANTSPGPLQFEWSGATQFGTQSYAVYQINLPNPLITDGQDEATKIPVETPIKGVGGYDSTTGGGVKVVLVNDTAAFATT